MAARPSLKMDPQGLSANWKKLQTTLVSDKNLQPSRPQNEVKRKRHAAGVKPSSAYNYYNYDARKRRRPNGNMAAETKDTVVDSMMQLENSIGTPQMPLASRSYRDSINAGFSPDVPLGRYVAIDCEMVGIGPNPDDNSALARVSIVNYNGDQVYDSYVKPLELVTDWRTHVSGIAPKHMIQARTLQAVQVEVAKILKDRIVVGHSIRKDFEVLFLSHPMRDVRDTARHPPYRKLAGGSSPRLKMLASELLGFDIQVGEHSSVEDARACMMLFRRDKAVFEQEHAKKWPTPTKRVEPIADDQKATKPVKRKKKKKTKKR